jgi:spore coat polysaccharide biosynthesis predicted glycosyltransferase SpsG
MSLKTAIFRVDASSKIGTGHVARSSVLALHLRREFQTHVIWAGTPETLSHMQSRGLQNSYNQFIKLPDVTAEYQPHAVAAMATFLPNYGDEKPLYVQDGMHLCSRSLSPIQEKGVAGLTVKIDERANPNVCLGAPSLLVDPLPHDPSVYTDDMISPDTHLLIGPQYQMISEHVRAQTKKRSTYRIRQQGTGEKNVVLMNGGMNIAGLLNYLVWGLASSKANYSNTRFHAYTLSKAKNGQALERAVSQVKRLGIDILLHIDQSPNYAHADLYVGAGGTSAFEFSAAGGLASVLIGAGNGQDDLGKVFNDRGAGNYIGTFWAQGRDGKNVDQTLIPQAIKHMNNLLFNDDLRAKMSAKSFSFCDGRGAERISQELMKASQLPLRVSRKIAL